MVELKRCEGYKGHWACSDEYPDHMVPVSRFGSKVSDASGLSGKCRRCFRYRWSLIPKHPVTGEVKNHWKYRIGKLLGGTRGTQGWKNYLDEAEVMWSKEIVGAMLKSGMDELKKYHEEGLGVPIEILKFKSKKPKFNQGLYKSSPATPTDSSKEPESREGPGDVYIFEDEMKMPGLIKIGATKDVDKRLQVGNTWGAFTCLYKKDFKRRFEAEAKIFELLEDYRLYSDKEWFKINTDLAIKTLEGMYEVQ